MRLKTSRSTLTAASHTATTTTSCGAPTCTRSHDDPTKNPASTSVTAGPIAATSISVLPVIQSLLI